MATTGRMQALDVITTSGCNLRCAYCYQNNKHEESLDWETLRGGLDLLMQSRRKDLRVGFYGGEPLLEFPLIRRAVAYLEESLPAGKSVRYVLITNGMLLDDEGAAFLASHDFQVRLSFDGVPAAQRLRGAKTFEVLNALLDRLRANQPRFYRNNLSINLTLAIPAIPHLADSVAYFIRKGLREVAISPVETQNSLWRLEMIDDLDRQFARLYRLCLKHFIRTGQVPVQNLRRGEDESVHAPRGGAMCGVAEGEVLALDVDGHMYGCAIFAESFQKYRTDFLKSRLEKMRLGDYREPGFRRRLAMYPQAAAEARIFDAKEEKHSAYGQCRDCHFLAQCEICPVSIGYIPGNSDPDRIPDHLCAFNLVALKYREKFPVARPTPVEIVTSRARIPRDLRRIQRIAQSLGAIEGPEILGRTE